MIRRVLLFAVALTAVSFASGLPTASPESAGVSSQRLKRIDVWLNELVKTKQAAGFVSLVARRGKVIHYEAFGTRGLSVGDPMPKEALFDLASMTKPITVAAALMLLEEGRITLHEPISNHLPEFKNVRVETSPGVYSAPARPIQVRDLFTHTSGVFPTRSRAEIFEHPTLQSFMQEIASLPLRAQPGRAWIYGTSHDVLGYLVQQVSGMPLDQFVQQRILSPLDMKDTYYWPPDAINARRAILVVNGKDDPESLSRVPPAAAKAKSYIGGASGL
jgi:CubicO group peptidase (beta-lactamase class C family)